MNRRAAVVLASGAALLVAGSLALVALGSGPVERVAIVDAALAPATGTATGLAVATDARATSVERVDAGAAFDASADATADATATPSAALDPRCRQLSAEIARMAARMAAADPTCGVEASALLAEFDHCAATVAGAWSLVPRRFEVHRDPGVDDGKSCSEIDVEVALVHLGARDDGGAYARSETIPFATVTDGSLAANWSEVPSGWGSRDLGAPVFVDYDGDGELEVILSTSVHEEGYDPGANAVDTFTASAADGGRIEPYPPARQIAFDEVADIDGDGRPDLMTRGPYAKISVMDALGNDSPLLEPIFAQHARPDGTFSARDDAARKALRKVCPTPPAEARDEASIGDVAQELVCARLHGISAATLRARLLPTCAALCERTSGCEIDAGDACPGWVAEVLDVPPFLRLP